MTGLRASHAHKPAHASAYFRAAEPVPSLLFPLSDISGLICAFARETGLFRGVFRLWRFFFIFFSRLMDTNFFVVQLVKHGAAVIPFHLVLPFRKAAYA